MRYYTRHCLRIVPVLLLYIICAAPLRAQENRAYIPMLGDSNWWTVHVYLDEMECFRDYYDYTALIYTQGDSLLYTGLHAGNSHTASKNGSEEYVSWHKVYAIDKYSLVVQGNDMYRPRPQYQGLLREDVEARQVYYIPAGEREEILLYDFSLTAEDSFYVPMRYSAEVMKQLQRDEYPLIYMVMPAYYKLGEVKDDGYIREMDMHRRTINGRDGILGVWDFGLNWREGVGSLRSPLYIYFPVVGSPFWKIYDLVRCKLICAGRDGEETYHDKWHTGECMFEYRKPGSQPSSLNEGEDVKNNLGMQLSPDGQHLFIHSQAAGNATLSLYDMSGRLL